MTNKTKAGLDAKALEAAQYTLEDAVRWGCEPADGLASAIVTYLSALPHAGVSECDPDACKAHIEAFMRRALKAEAALEASLSQHAEAVPVAWWLVENKHGVIVRGERTKQDAEQAEGGLWEGDRVFPVYASPVPSDAGEPGIKADEIAEEARRYAGFYPEASDGRNTFIIFAEWIERRSAVPTTSPAKGGADGPVPAHECEFSIGQPVRLTHPYPEMDPDTVFYITGISWEHRMVPASGWNIEVATKEDIQKGYGQTDGYRPDDLQPLRTSAPVGKEQAKEGGE